MHLARWNELLVIMEAKSSERITNFCGSVGSKAGLSRMWVWTSMVKAWYTWKAEEYCCEREIGLRGGSEQCIQRDTS